MLEQGAAGAVHHRLGWSGGAGGEHHEQRVVEVQPRPRRGLRRRLFGLDVEPGDRPPAGLGGWAAVEDEHGAQARQRVEQGVQGVATGAGPVRGAAAIHHQRRGLDLLEPTEQGAGSHVGHGRGDRGAERGGGEHGDDGAGVVRGDHHDAVAGAHAVPGEGGRGGADPGAQRGAGDVLDAAVAVHGGQRGPVVVDAGQRAQQVLGVVQPHVGEEHRGLDVVTGAHDLGRALPRQLRPLQEQPPERPVLGHRPAVEVLRHGQVDVRVSRALLSEPRQLRRRAHLQRRRRIGERVRHASPPSRCSGGHKRLSRRRATLSLG